MRTEQRTVYISDDGQEFDSEDACLNYEKVRKFSCIVEEHISRFASDYYDSCARKDIAEAIAGTFPELIRKYNEL